MTSIGSNRKTNLKELTIRVMACLVALVLVVCCHAYAGIAAYADDGASSAASPAAPAPTDPAEDAGTTDDAASNKDADTGDAASDASAEPATPAPTEDATASEPTAEPSSGSASKPASDPVTAGTSNSSQSAASAKSSEKTEEEKAEEEKQKQESDAASKRAEAASLIEQADSLNASIAQLQAEYDQAKRAFDEATELKESTTAQLELETASLERLKVDLADYVVVMYKQGGIAPYLDVLFSSTSFKEFATSWHVMNEVPQYGRDVFQKKNEEVAGLREAITTYEEQIEQAERDMKSVELKKRQLEVSQLALKTQAATLEYEAAQLLGDEEALESAAATQESCQEALEELIKQGPVGESVLSGGGVFTHPCPDARYSSGFGYRSFDNAFHKGLDMAAPEGTPYYAADSGTVTNATNGGGYNGGAGNWVVIDHGNGIVTKYMHSLVTFVSPGDHVERGQNIGLVGNTGNSFGAHLHFQVEVYGTAVNPLSYL